MPKVDCIDCLGDCQLSVTITEAAGDRKAWSLFSLGCMSGCRAEGRVLWGVFFALLRVATTGRTAAPPIFQTMEVLGRERCVKRVRAALKRLRRITRLNPS